MSFVGKPLSKNRTVQVDLLPLLEAIESEISLGELLSHFAENNEFEADLLVWLIRDSGVDLGEFVRKLQAQIPFYKACRTVKEKKQFAADVKKRLTDERDFD